MFEGKKPPSACACPLIFLPLRSLPPPSSPSLSTPAISHTSGDSEPSLGIACKDPTHRAKKGCVCSSENRSAGGPGGGLVGGGAATAWAGRRRRGRHRAWVHPGHSGAERGHGAGPKSTAFPLLLSLPPLSTLPSATPFCALHRLLSFRPPALFFFLHLPPCPCLRPTAL